MWDLAADRVSAGRIRVIFGGAVIEDSKEVCACHEKTGLIIT